MKKRTLNWKEIHLFKIDPYVYPTFYSRNSTFSTIVEGHVFYSDNPIAKCDVFYEQIDNGCWLMAMEIHSKSNNHYVIHRKRTKQDYCSINIFSTPNQRKFSEEGDFRDSGDHVRFVAPGADFDFYQREGTVLKICRLIFSHDYLVKLISSVQKSTSEADLINHSQFYNLININRTAASVEILIQSRLFNVLRYERGKYHYYSSIYSDFFKLTAFFLNYRYGRNWRM